MLVRLWMEMATLRILATSTRMLEREYEKFGLPIPDCISSTRHNFSDRFGDVYQLVFWRIRLFGYADDCVHLSSSSSSLLYSFLALFWTLAKFRLYPGVLQSNTYLARVSCLDFLDEVRNTMDFQYTTS